MDELVKKLDSLASRSKLSKKNLAEAVDALWHFYELNQDEVATASYLMQFKPEVAYHFYTRAASSWEEAEARRVYQAFTATAGYTKNIKNAGTGRAFAIAAALLQQQKEYARDFLSQALAQVERKGQYSQSVLVLFAQQIEALVGWEELKRLYALPWENEKGQRVWLNLSAQGERQWGRTPDPTPKAEATEVTARETLPLVELPSLAKIESINLDLAELGILARNSREEAQNMFQNIQDNLVALRAVTTMIEQSKLALPSLTLPAEVEEKDSYRSEATALVTASPEHETRQQETINELTHKLQNAMQMSNFTSEQAVLTLKKDIGSGLRLEYQDFLQDKDMPYNETGYTSFRNSLVRIFMVLQRHGIILE